MWCYLGHLITCFAFQEFIGAILSSNEILFDGLITWVGSFTSLLANALSNVVRACLCSCVSPTTRTWLFVRPNTFSFRLSSTHFLITLRIHLGIPHPMVAHLSWCQCGCTIDDLGIYLLHCPCKSEHITTHDNFVIITLDNGTQIQKEVSHLFPHHTWKQMDIVITRWFLDLGRCCHYKFDSYKFGAMCFNNDNTCSNSCDSKQSTILHRANTWRWFHSPWHRHMVVSIFILIPFWLLVYMPL